MRREYTRIKFDIDVVRTAIYECKNQYEMAEKFGCSRETIKHYLLDNDLYEEYCTADEAVIARLRGEAKYFQEYSPNYNIETQQIELTYISRTDNLEHHIEMNLDGDVLVHDIKELYQ